MSLTSYKHTNQTKNIEYLHENANTEQEHHMIQQMTFRTQETTKTSESKLPPNKYSI
jgi:hypothetical protein